MKKSNWAKLYANKSYIQIVVCVSGVGGELSLTYMTVLFWVTFVILQVRGLLDVM